MGVGRNYVLDLPMQLGGAVTKHRIVTLTGDQQATQAAALGAVPLGVAMETATAQDATDGRVISVAVLGTAVVEADAAIAVGAKLYSSADGQALTIPAAQTNVAQLGIAMTAASAAGEWITVLLTPGAQVDT